MYTETTNAFKWTFIKTIILDGETARVRVSRKVDSDGLPAITFFTSGVLRGECDHPTHRPKPKYAGDLSTEMTWGLPPCLATFTAVGQAEFWCIHRGVNGRHLPSVYKLVIPAGGEYSLDNNTRLFICRGDAHIGDISVSEKGAIHLVSGPRVLVAKTDLYALALDRERDAT